mgnify:CR=1 FL=1
MNLTVISARDRKAYRFSDGKVTLGRDPSNAVVLSDEGVSRFHAEVWRERTGWRIKDCGSTNGTSVNGLPVENTGLREGDNISIGDVTITFSMEEPYRVKQLVVWTTIAVLSGIVVSLLFLGKSVDRSSQVTYSSGGEEKSSGATKTGSMPGDQRQAEQLLKLGQEHLKDWRIKRGNAFRAQKAFEQAIPLLQGQPRAKDIAQKGLEEARRRVDEEFKHYRFLAEKAIQIGDMKTAEEDLKAILEVVPEANDPRASYAQERIRALGRGVIEGD